MSSQGIVLGQDLEEMEEQASEILVEPPPVIQNHSLTKDSLIIEDPYTNHEPSTIQEESVIEELLVPLRDMEIDDKVEIEEGIFISKLQDVNLRLLTNRL